MKYHYFILALLIVELQGCYFIDHFSGKSDSDQSTTGIVAIEGVLGQSLGAKAGAADEAALDALRSVSTSIAPAGLRPDPDLYARRLLLQYREEGTTVARQIGSIEAYRSLLGGASQDFQKPPQEDFDATSLLAKLTVSERICEALINPNPTDHEGWATILPDIPAQWENNILFLAQRFIGKHSSDIDQTILDELKAILDLNNTDGSIDLEDYVSVCSVLAIDAESLHL